MTRRIVPLAERVFDERGCGRCGDGFTPTAPAEKYCSLCRPIVYAAKGHVSTFRKRYQVEAVV